MNPMQSPNTGVGQNLSNHGRSSGLNISSGYVCPKCGGNLYKDEGDEGPCWYECEKCDFECDSDFDRKTGEIFPDFILHNAKLTDG